MNLVIFIYLYMQIRKIYKILKKSKIKINYKNDRFKTKF